MDIRWSEVDRYVALGRCGPSSDGTFLLMSFNDIPIRIGPFPLDGVWTKRLDSSALAWGGPGEAAPASIEFCEAGLSFMAQPYNAILYEKQAASVCYNSNIRNPKL